MGGDGLLQVSPHKSLELGDGLQGIPPNPVRQGQQLPISRKPHLVLSGIEDTPHPFLGRPLMIDKGVPPGGVKAPAFLPQAGDYPDAVRRDFTRAL